MFLIFFDRHLSGLCKCQDRYIVQDLTPFLAHYISVDRVSRIILAFCVLTFLSSELIDEILVDGELLHIVTSIT